MKVRIEFGTPDDDEDGESFFDSVEFTTPHAGSASEWGYAVLEFLRAASWSQEQILVSALMQTDIELSDFWLSIEENRKELLYIRDKLTKLLERESI